MNSVTTCVKRALSKGEIVVYLNADDFLLPQAFKTVLPYFEAGAEFVVGKVEVLREDGSRWVNDPRVGRLDILRLARAVGTVVVKDQELVARTQPGVQVLP